MESRFLTEFDETLDSQFYLCRSCKTHIAVREDYLYKAVYVWPDKTVAYFEKAVNLVIDEDPENYVWHGNYGFTRVYCSKCDLQLGQRCVKTEPPTTAAIKAGRFLLYLDRLQFWDGLQVQDKDLLEPQPPHPPLPSMDSPPPPPPPPPPTSPEKMEIPKRDVL